MTAYHDNMDRMSLEAHMRPFTSTFGSVDDTATPTPPPLKKRRTPNAFIVFRSFMIANRSYPLELRHQSDVSRYIAALWRGLSETERSYFFKVAEEKRAAVELEGSSPSVRRKRRTRKNRRSRPSKVSDPYVYPYAAQGPSSEPSSSASLPSLYATEPGLSIDFGLQLQSPASDSGSSTSHLWTYTNSPNSHPTDVASSSTPSTLPAFAFSQCGLQPYGPDSPQTPQDLSPIPPCYSGWDTQTSFSALGLEWQGLQKFEFESSSIFDSSFSTAMCVPGPECFVTLDAFRAEQNRTRTHKAPPTDLDFDAFFGNAYIHPGSSL